jgi:hypothetical protein
MDLAGSIPALPVDGLSSSAGSGASGYPYGVCKDDKLIAIFENVVLYLFDDVPF